MIMLMIEIVKVIVIFGLGFYLLGKIVKAYVYRPEKVTKQMYKAIEAGMEYHLKMLVDGKRSVTSEALWVLYKQEQALLNAREARIVNEKIKQYLSSTILAKN